MVGRERKNPLISLSSPKMSHGRTRTRPLGLVRHTVSDSVPKFPPLRVSREVAVEKLDRNYQGVHGNAMNVPPPRNSPERMDREAEVKSKTPRSTRPITTKSDSSVKSTEENADRKELKEALSREIQLKKEIMSLQKLIDSLKMQIQKKDANIAGLIEQFKQQEEKYTDLLKKEEARHAETKADLNNTKVSLEGREKAMEELKTGYEQRIQDLTTLMDTKLQELTKEKDGEIETRDKKLTNLKKQMAEALKGNSWERQQQLDELTKELSRVQEENEMLRMKMRSQQKGKGGSCNNCQAMTNKVNQFQKAMTDKDLTINELKALCAKFEKQLVQQDLLLQQWAESKGHTVAGFPK